MVDYLVQYLRILFTEMPFLVLVALGAIVALVLRRRKPIKRDDPASRVLDEIARRAEAELRARGVPFTAVTATWSYGWPKIQIEFATPELEASAKASEELRSICKIVSESIRCAPEFGKQASKIDPNRTVWLTVTGQPGYRHP